MSAQRARTPLPQSRALRCEDPLAGARGVVWGVVFALPAWGIALALVWKALS